MATQEENQPQKGLKEGLTLGGGKLKNRLLNQSDCSWDNSIPTEEYFKELFRVSKNQIIWGGNYFPLPPTRGIIAWDKCQPWENFSQFELAWSSFDKPASLWRFSNTGGRNDVVKFHPTQKPVQLYNWLLKKYAQKGWKILDTHHGSGSLSIACHLYGFEIDATEIDLYYYNKSIEWLQNIQLQQQLMF